MEEKGIKKHKDKRKNRNIKLLITFILLACISFFLYKQYDGKQVENISVIEFEEKLDDKSLIDAKDIILFDNVGLITYEWKDKIYKVKIPKNYIKENSTIIQQFKDLGVELKVENKKDWLLLTGNAFRILFTLLILFLVFKLLEDFFKSVDIQEVKGETLTFQDVAGAEAIKTEFADIIHYFKDPDKYASFKEDLPKGILLEGPPGNGKTYVAKALAGECGIPFFQKSTSDLEGKYVGIGSENIGKIFKVVRERAKEAGGAILFLDELDSIATKREMRTVVETTQTLNKLLTELDGFEKETNIIVVAATNLVSSLDEAVIRPGRFDRIIHVAKPTTPERVEVLDLYLKKKGNRIEQAVYDAEFSKTLAEITEGFSNAQLANLVKESSVLARRKQKETIGIQELREGFTKVIAGVKRNRQMTDEDRKIVAYHEAGHAVAQMITSPLGVKGIAYITITPYGESLGHVSPIASPSKLKKKSDLEHQVMVLLAGRAVEDKILQGDYTVGAANDLHHANNIITDYLTTYGMASHLPNLYIQQIEENNNLFQGNLKKLREDFYARTQDLVEQHYDMVKAIAEHLLTHESIEQHELESIVTHCPSYEAKLG